MNYALLKPTNNALVDQLEDTTPESLFTLSSPNPYHTCAQTNPNFWYCVFQVVPFSYIALDSEVFKPLCVLQTFQLTHILRVIPGFCRVHLLSGRIVSHLHLARLR